MKTATLALNLLILHGLAVVAQQPVAGEPQPASSMADMHHGHASGMPVSYAELKDTVTLLDRARQATAKYQDVRVAEAEGYRAIGPDVPGMGVHFVLSKQAAGSDVTAKVSVPQKREAGFDADRPPILLYEKNTSGGYSLVGVSYLLNATEGSDGQPLNPPFPKSLATWHRHENICVLPDRSTPHGLTENQCQAQGGHFTAETQWMIHAWIWKDSPLGVFSPTNPAVR